MPVLAPPMREQRRQNLIQAAWRCAARKGFRELTVDEICIEAGVSKGSFYGYFESKQKLLLTLLDEDARALEAIMERLSTKAESGLERLQGFARAMLERGEDSGRVQVLADLWATLGNEDVLRERFSEVTRRRRALLRGWVEQAVAAGELMEVPANALASILLALGDGLMLHAGLDPTGFQWRNVRTALLKLLEGMRS